MTDESRKVRRTLYEMLRNSSLDTLHTVFAHRDSVSLNPQAKFFYTLYNIPSDQNLLEVKVGDKHVLLRRWEHLEDLHLPDLSSEDAHYLMLSPSKKKIYDSLIPLKR